MGPCRILLVLSASLFLPSVRGGAPAPEVSVAKNEWTVFHGNPLQTGVAASSLPEDVEILWKYETKDSIEGAPAVAGGIVYVASMDENLYALNLADGKMKWAYKGGAFKASPAVHGDTVYVGDGDGKFHCVDAATGRKRWIFETGAEITGGANFHGDLILFGSYDETLYCLTADGKVKWQFKTQGPFNGSPAVADGRTFVAGCDSNVHVVDIAKGTELTAVDLGSQSGATAAVNGDHLYVGTMGNQVQAIDWKKGAAQWTFQPAKRAQAFYSSAAVTSDLVVLGSRDKRIYALERKTGAERWNFVTGGRVDSSPVVVGSRVFCGSQDANLYVLDLATGRQLKKIELDDAIAGSPAVAAGCLLIGTQKGTLYCFGAKQDASRKGAGVPSRPSSDTFIGGLVGGNPLMWTLFAAAFVGVCIAIVIDLCVRKRRLSLPQPVRSA
jgi:outer membrane protein assembly factor BamB